MGADHFGSLKGRSILYTGAAGGLGLETTLELLRSGAKVVAIDNDANKVAALLDAAQGLGGLTVAKLDLADLTGLRAGLQKLSAELGGFDVVINNAAIYPAKPFEAYTIEERIYEAQALQRRGAPADIANILMFLASDAASFITGQTIHVDGGWYMH